jgi:uncharacterized protein
VLRAALRSVTGAAEAAITPLGAISADLREQQAAPREVAHRPWPLPDAPWVMGQTWQDLLFAHWPVDPGQLRGLVPAQVPLDLFDGTGWLGITPFEVTGLRLRGTPPVPPLSSFPELNVRTYVTLDGKPGIWFFSLDAASAMAVAAARATYLLPYFRARMRIVRRAGETITYHSERVHPGRHGVARLHASYGPAGPEVGAGDEVGRWLAERYCLYTVDGSGRVHRADIHHRLWPLQPAWAELAQNTMGAALGIRLGDAPLLHYSRRQDTLIWPLRRA